MLQEDALSGILNVLADLPEDELRRNFSFWVAQWDPCVRPATHPGFGERMPTTTTFPYEKRWGDAEDQRRFPYREILFEDKALLSEHGRVSLGKHGPAEPRRDMSKVRSIGLDRFVFAYLGIHDPYYADVTTFPNPPFGIFVPIRLDRFPHVNATRRDLHSPEAQWPPNREFLLPEDARKLCDLQCCNDSRHANDFWHYWGSPRHWIVGDYALQHWKWLIELHYLDAVPADDFHAVLWPEEVRPIGASKVTKSLVDRPHDAFLRDHPTCSVIPYSWSPLEPTMTFVRASYAVARYFLSTGEYPLHADDAWELLADAT